MKGRWVYSESASFALNDMPCYESNNFIILYIDRRTVIKMKRVRSLIQILKYTFVVMSSALCNIFQVH